MQQLVLKTGIWPVGSSNRALKVKVSAKLSGIRLLHAKWILDLYNRILEKKDMIIHGFKSAGVTEAIQSAKEIVAKAENPFHEYSVRASGML